MSDFLFELGTEELPAGMLEGLRDDLGHKVAAALEAEGLPDDSVRSFAAPRRLGVLVSGLPARQADRTEAVVGPAMAVARDAAGVWTKAAEGFARKQAVALADCTEVAGPKGLCIGFTRTVAGRNTAAILAARVPAVVESLHLPKAMRWGAGEQTFVRAVRWVVALLDDTVVPMTVKGIAAGRTSRGHRVHGGATLDVPSAAAYFDTLKAAFVLSDPETREGRIRGHLAALSGALGGRVEEDSELIASVCAMNEYPTVIAGAIAEEFLSLPAEVLVTCLREHQKFFVVVDDAGKPLPHFLAVMEGPSDPEGLVRRGYENVTRARLADAKFFYGHDVAVSLDKRLEDLKGIVYHPKLGTYFDKAQRLEGLARKLAPFFQADADLAGEAARLCKADLASLLVQEKEFTSLQGVAGGLYAKVQGKNAALARAISEHYGTPMCDSFDMEYACLGIVVALADKLDTLIQFFSIGLFPTGSKDPFALRRAASEVVTLLSAPGYASDSHLPPGGFRFDLGEFLRAEAPACRDALSAFLLERARFHWEGETIFSPTGEQTSNSRGTGQDRPFVAPSPVSYDELNAILIQGLDNLLDMRRRLQALHNVRLEFPEDFDALSVAHKRAKNLTKDQPLNVLDPSRLLPDSEKEGEGERNLYVALVAAEEETRPMLETRDYVNFLRRLARLRPPVDQFFADVLVMCDPEGKDPEKTARQNNRLALLQRLVALFDRVADFSQIVPGD